MGRYVRLITVTPLRNPMPAYDDMKMRVEFDIWKAALLGEIMDKKINVFISQPMNGMTEDEIKAARKEAEDYVVSRYTKNPSDLNFIDSYTEDDVPKDSNEALGYLAGSLRALADADIVYFAPGWNKARGCSIEHTCAEQYGIPCITQDVPEASEEGDGE